MEIDKDQFNQLIIELRRIADQIELVNNHLESLVHNGIDVSGGGLTVYTNDDEPLRVKTE